MTTRVALTKGPDKVSPERQPVSVPDRLNQEPAGLPLLAWSYGDFRIQPKLQVGAADDPLEREADQVAQRVMRKCAGCAHEEEETHEKVARKAYGAPGPTCVTAPGIVADVLRQPGTPLDGATRQFFESRFQRDFSSVRIHAGSAAAASARAIQARAYTAGTNVVFGRSEYQPGSEQGRELLAHELAHVVQQGGERLRRRIEMRDVGRGEQSGFARLPELVDRLNGVSNGLVFQLDDHNNLTYTENPYGTMTNFEQQMKGFIDSGTVIPLRLTNSHGLLGSRTVGFHTQVNADDFSSGYVDIDDLLASEDLNLQTVLVHLLAERAATGNYARRIGTLADPDTGDLLNQPEFDRAHRIGLEAETQVLRDFFGDPTIRFVNEPDTGPFDRVWRNRRRDLIRERRTSRQGVDAFSTSVRTHDGRTMTGVEYRDLLAAEAAAAAAPP